MGAFLVYILTLTSKAEDHIALLLIRRCLMVRSPMCKLR